MKKLLIIALLLLAFSLLLGFLVGSPQPAPAPWDEGDAAGDYWDEQAGREAR